MSVRADKQGASEGLVRQGQALIGIVEAPTFFVRRKGHERTELWNLLPHRGSTVYCFSLHILISIFGKISLNLLG